MFSRKSIWLFVPLIIILVIAVFFIFTDSQPVTVPEIITEEEITAPEELEEVEALPLGAHFMIGHWANTPVASTTALIAEHKLGGVIIMSAPEDPEEIKEWVQEWQTVSSFPLLIAIDQEGGVVSRLKGENFIQTSQREIRDSYAALKTAQTRGEELATLGINMNFAPVLDTANNPDSFMYQRVFPIATNAAELAAAMIKGMGDKGVIAVPKHFPGHDDTKTDSHLELPIVDIAENEINDFIKPFTDLLKNNPPQVLMTAHVAFPAVGTLPATLSSYWLTDKLRGEIGYGGIIITDDMSMKGVSDVMSASEAAVTTLRAGADIMLLAAAPEEITEMMQAVQSTYESDNSFRETLRQSSDRLRRLLEAM